MVIRQVQKSDYKGIYELVKEAFTTAEVTNGKEQDYVNEVRMKKEYLPQLEFVAEEDGNFVGHILLSEAKITTKNGEHSCLYIAPVCVSLAYRNRGIGEKLIKYASKEGIKLGFDAIFLVGNPKYYGRFGFKQTSFFGIKNISEVPDEVVLGCELIPNALYNIKGTIKLD